MLDKRILEDLKSKGFEVNSNGELLRYTGKNPVVALSTEITSVAEGAFEDNKTLKNLYFLSSVKRVGEGAFRGCTALESVAFNDGLTVIEAEAFEGCTALRSVSLPETVLTVGRRAFYNCSRLGTVKLNEGITEIPDECFSGCKLLMKLEIPSGVVEIGIGAFEKCSSLAKVELPQQLRIIGARAFYGCSKLGAQVVMPDKVELIGEYAFAKCTALGRFTLPLSLRTLERGCFSGCINLYYVENAYQLEYIGPLVFEDCSALRTVALGAAKMRCHPTAFRRCDLEKIFAPTSHDWIYKNLGKRYSSYIPKGVFGKLLVSPFFVSLILLLLFGGALAALGLTSGLLLPEPWIGVFSLVTSVAALGSLVMLAVYDRIGWQDPHGRALYYIAPIQIAAATFFTLFGALVPPLPLTIGVSLVAISVISHYTSVYGYIHKEDGTVYLRHPSFIVPIGIASVFVFIAIASLAGVFESAAPHWSLVIVYFLFLGFYTVMSALFGKNDWHGSRLEIGLWIFSAVLALFAVACIFFSGFAQVAWLCHLISIAVLALPIAVTALIMKLY